MPAELQVILAGLPILLLAGLLLSRIPPIPAVLATIGVTLALGFWFPMSVSSAGEITRLLLPVTISVALIIFGGVLLAQFLAVSGGQDRIGDWVSAAANSPERAVLLIGLGVSPLAESIIGWGAGVFISVPLLLRIGLTATKAATVGLLGLVLAPWGSLGPGIILMSEVSGVSTRDIGLWSAILTLPVLLIMGAAISLVGMGMRTAWSMSGETLMTVLTMGVTVIVLNAWVSVPLAGVLASFAGMACVLFFSRLRGGPLLRLPQDTLSSLAPYLVLTIGLLAMTGFTAIVDLGQWGDILVSPALWLLLAAASAPFFLSITHIHRIIAARQAVRLFVPVSVITLLFITFGGIVVANGMSSTLADTAANLGSGVLLAVPLIGSVGGYITGSNTATGAMFARGIAEAAHAVGVSPGLLLGSQNVATGVAVMAAPGRVALSVNMVNSLRRDGEAPVDTARVLMTVLAANLALLVALTPLTWFLGTGLG